MFNILFRSLLLFIFFYIGCNTLKNEKQAINDINTRINKDEINYLLEYKKSNNDNLLNAKNYNCIIKNINYDYVNDINLESFFNDDFLIKNKILIQKLDNISTNHKKYDFYPNYVISKLDNESKKKLYEINKKFNLIKSTSENKEKLLPIIIALLYLGYSILKKKKIKKPIANKNLIKIKHHKNPFVDIRKTTIKDLKNMDFISEETRNRRRKLCNQWYNLRKKNPKWYKNRHSNKKMINTLT